MRLLAMGFELYDLGGGKIAYRKVKMLDNDTTGVQLGGTTHAPPSGNHTPLSVYC